MRKIAAVGFVLVAAMQVVFAFLGTDRPAPYREVQFVSAAASLALAWGAWTWHPMALTIGFAVNGITRVLQPILGLTRLPMWLNVILATGWIVAAIRTGLRRDARIGLWILAIGYALSVFTAFARMAPAIALTLSAAGLFLAAPNTHK